MVLAKTTTMTAVCDAYRCHDWGENGMKLLRIDESGDLAGPLLLHPQLSVISGVRGASRARLIASLAAVSYTHLTLPTIYSV